MCGREGGDNLRQFVYFLGAGRGGGYLTFFPPNILSSYDFSPPIIWPKSGSYPEYFSGGGESFRWRGERYGYEYRMM